MNAGTKTRACFSTATLRDQGKHYVQLSRERRPSRYVSVIELFELSIDNLEPVQQKVDKMLNFEPPLVKQFDLLLVKLQFEKKTNRKLLYRLKC